MLKEERQKTILDLVNKQDVVKVSEFIPVLQVTEMTVRRDLQELENKKLLKRIHGGAQKYLNMPNHELSHLEKKLLQTDSKVQIAKKIAALIGNGDTVFLGPGTTIELVYDYMSANYAKIVTNSIYVFNQFVNDSRYELILIGGTYRNRTGAFVGSIANDTLSTLKLKKSFIGVNSVSDDAVSNSNEEEGMTQKIILNNSQERYIIADSSKLNKDDFYQFYALSNTTALITDNVIKSEDLEYYHKYTKIL